jgi:hypothetical protein
MDEEPLRRVFGAYNARNVAAAIALTDASVRWGLADDGGFVSGHAGLRELWRRQWSTNDAVLEPTRFDESEDGNAVVEVVRRQRKGELLEESMQLQTFSFGADGLIVSMELSSARRGKVLRL